LVVFLVREQVPAAGAAAEFALRVKTLLMGMGF
jgi:hypothetical protein